MTPDESPFALLDLLTVGLVVAVAVAFLSRRYWWKRGKGGGGGCPGCGGACGGSSGSPAKPPPPHP